MSHLHGLGALLLALALGIVPTVAAESDKPNIVYILADDLGWKDVGFHGSEIKTPSLDELARTGVTLDQFYSQQMCTPARAALMTGRYPLRYGLQSFVILPDQTYGLPTDEWLLPQALKEAGYETAIIGKWHLGHGSRDYWPRQRGFDYQYGPLIGEIDYFTHLIHGVTDWFINNQPLEQQGYVTTLLGDDAVRLISAHDTAKPLFLYLAFTSPHTPYQAPQDYLDRYPGVSDPNRRAYDAMISVMDDQIGRVLDALEDRGMRENTIVIFHSDNGGTRDALFAGEIETSGDLPPDNGPFRGGKGSLYEGGTRVVALANWPGRIKPGSAAGMIHVVDMFPTLAALAGASTAKSKPLDGMNVWPTISKGAASPRQDVVYNIEMFRGAVREGDWKLVWNTTLPSKTELFNIPADPSETNDLAAAHPDIVSRLQERVQSLAVEMARSKFFAATMEAYTGRHIGPPAFPPPPTLLPDDPGFFETVD
jgi:arylsulfatase A-like enzyme